MELDSKKAFLVNLDMLLEETFEQVHGYYLDKNTSLLETLATITAAQASVPVGGNCATLAAQVKHTTFYLQVVEGAMRDPKFPHANWGKIWAETHTVTDAEWKAIVTELATQYKQVRSFLSNPNSYLESDHYGMAMGVLAHTAYHVGEIRQALCILTDH